MPIFVKFNGGATTQQASVIPDATPGSDGVMTAAQAAKLAAQGPSPFQTQTTVIAQSTTPNSATVGSFGLTQDGAYIGGVRVSVTANNGADYALGIFPFLVLRQGGVVTQLESTLQGAPLNIANMVGNASNPNNNGNNNNNNGNNNNNSVVLGIATPGFNSLPVSIQIVVNGGDVDYVVQGPANFRFDTYWGVSP